MRLYSVGVIGVSLSLLGGEIQNPPSGFYKHRDVVVRAQGKIMGSLWDPYLLAQIEQESHWINRRTSGAGARGLTQFIVPTQRGIERKYGVRGSIWNVKHAATLQAYLMRENLKACESVFDGFHNVWTCALRIYNGSPRSFWREHHIAGHPPRVSDMVGTCVRARHHCRENWRYPIEIRDRRKKYTPYYPGYPE